MKKLKKILLFTLIGLIAVVVMFMIFISLKRPSHDREWQEGLELAQIDRQDDIISISKVRNSTYNSDGLVDLQYEARTVDVTKLESIWFVVEPFSELQAAAHTMFTFGFNDGTFLGVSVEARKEVGEKFSLISGLLNELELVYVWATEEDLLKRRGVWLDHPLYLYKLEVNKNVIRNIFLEMIEETALIYEQPQFYHSINKTCTSSLAHRVNEAYPGTVSVFAPGQYLPGYADKLIYKLGLLAGQGTFEEIKAQSYVTTAIQTNADKKDFSHRIRKDLPIPKTE